MGSEPSNRRKRKTKVVAPFLTPKPIQFVIAPNVSTARQYRDRGWCPVECSFGPTTVEDDLKMDHHGKNSDRTGVAIRAYKDHFATRRPDPRFVVTGTPDEDLTFAVASLSGVIPHPSLADKLEGAPGEVRDLWSRDYGRVAEIINQVDVDPTQVNLLTEDHWGKLVLAWRLLTNMRFWDVSAFHSGVDRWRTLLTQRSYDLANAAPVLLEAHLKEVDNVRIHQVSERVALIDCSLWGYSSTYVDVWHKRAPVIFAWYADHSQHNLGRVTVCVDGIDTA